jgi:ABC-type multidrug transport system fused ATPase/permease subunit
LAAPYGRGKLGLVVATIFANGIMQVVGVVSIFPFFALAAEPDRIRNSRFGSAILSYLPSMDHSTLLIFAGMASIILLLVSNLFSLLGEVVRMRYGHGLGHYLRTHMLRSLAGRPYGYFLERNSGALMQKLLGDVGQFINGVLLPLLECLTRVVTLALLLLTIFLVHPLIALGAALGLGGFYATIFLRLRHRARRLGEGLQTANAGTHISAQQFFGGIKPILVHGKAPYFIGEFETFSAQQARLNPLIPIYSNTPRYLIEPIAFGGLVLVVVWLATQGRPFADILPNLSVMALAGYRTLPSFQMLYGQITQINAVRYVVAEVQAELAEFHTLQNQTSPPPTRTGKLVFEKNIELTNITFQYPRSAKPVLENFNLTIPKNSSLGIIGKTGSGKSTLVDILLGLHTPQSGEIRIDGHVLTPEELPQWRAMIGYVPQDIYLLDATVAQNIAFGVPQDQIDMTAVIESARAAQIKDFVENELPLQWQTRVGERGVRLSGGQRQRIGLARALYHKPDILILDEATSALDHQTEAEVMRAIAALRGRLTLIIIAHRLTTLEECNEIIRLTPPC